MIMKLNVRDFIVANRIIDLLSSYRRSVGRHHPMFLKIPIDELVKELHLGTSELEALGLIGVPFPTFFNIPIKIIHQRSYLSLESYG